MADPRTPVVLYGGSGYVAGELFRLLAAHPGFRVAAFVSHSQVGQFVSDPFPHLHGAARGARFVGAEEALASVADCPAIAACFATPHGETARQVCAALDLIEGRGQQVRIIDLSADFRLPAETFARLYGTEPAAAQRLEQFTCALPDLAHTALAGTGTLQHIAHPGCFTTAVTLAAYPFLVRGWVEPDLFVSAVTGSSGSGRMPTGGTHHPDRAHNLYAYAPLAHRHEAEMRRLLTIDGREPEVEFVPHSGPFVRGIHATLRFRLRGERTLDELRGAIDATYAGSAFVASTAIPPQLRMVVGTNHARIGLAVRGRTLVVTSVIDNLVKGAAGGAVQWMNRLFGLAPESGLSHDGLGWY
ncbi:MAG: N-acetyl-gamma-glutamyl-phosphate reductase [Candidatus Eisenbacteria bacterium]|nr:N-acetyl-gamma-glutamyl-phosphate reductase [Candidatus Eisenbacteria bacterium]MCC7144741.1 N-acetyl-gamma-glutamyl-phosphate reductase [Candidatus Eisenbacteria bacterium]